MILDEIKNIKGTKQELRKFGFIIGLVLLLFGVLFWWKGKSFYLGFLVSSFLFLFSALVYPQLLKLVHFVWMSIALVLGYIMTRVILCLLFYLLLTPLSLIARVFGNRFLNLKIDKSAPSYWIYKTKESFDILDYEKQF